PTLEPTRARDRRLVSVTLAAPTPLTSHVKLPASSACITGPSPLNHSSIVTFWIGNAANDAAKGSYASFTNVVVRRDAPPSRRTGSLASDRPSRPLVESAHGQPARGQRHCQ